MSGYRVVTGADGYTIWHPRTPRVGTCGLILFPGQSNPYGYMDAFNQQASVTLAAALASSGIPTITSTFGGNTWANNTMQATIPAHRAALQAAFPAMRTDKICVLGISMGGAAATRYTQLNPASVAAVVGIIPAYDPKAIYVNNEVGDAAMEAAWSFSGLANFPDALDLGTKAALASSVPLLTGYASNDTIVPAASVTAYHTAAGGDPANIVNVGALGHTDAAIAALSIATIARFLVAHGA